jgi:hypothetical protein
VNKPFDKQIDDKVEELQKMMQARKVVEDDLQMSAGHQLISI